MPRLLLVGAVWERDYVRREGRGEKEDGREWEGREKGYIKLP